MKKDKQNTEPGRSTATIKIGLLEDQLLFRKGMMAILAAWPNLEVVFESAEGYSILKKLEETEVLPDVMLVDLSLPPDEKREFSGLDVTRVLRDKFPDMKVLILSVHEDDHFIAMLMKNGAHGYLIKESSPREVYDAIVSVHTRGFYVNEKTLRAIQGNTSKKKNKITLPAITGLVTLTKREEEILQLICQQKTTEEIAAELFISPKTVDGHRNNLLQKTGSRNVVGLVAFALTRKS